MYKDLCKEFASLCIAHGFSKQGKVFSRCIGDAVYQNISIASSEYLSPNSPIYSSTNRKSPVIRFGFWSMYSDLHPLYFTDRRYAGTFSPENFLGLRFGTGGFMGFQNQFEIMISTGFSKLDSITTQQAVISAQYELQQAKYGSVMPHSVDLCGPLLLCGENDKALSFLYGLYAQNWLNFREKYSYLKRDGEYETYFKHEATFDKKMERTTQLLSLVLGNRHAEIKAFLLSCLERNLQLAKDNRIKFSDDFLPLYKS